jgi:hypothetical protein
MIVDMWTLGHRPGGQDRATGQERGTKDDSGHVYWQTSEQVGLVLLFEYSLQVREGTTIP